MKNEPLDNFWNASVLDAEEEFCSGTRSLSAAVGGCYSSSGTRAACKEAIDHIAMVLSISRQGTILEANEKFSELTSYRPHEALGTNVRAILFDRDISALSRQAMQAAREGGVWQGEIGFIAKHGGVIWSQVTVVPQHRRHGSVGGFVLLGLDITERKQAEFSMVEERRRREDMEGLIKDIVEAVPDGIVAYDEAGKVIFFNEAHKKLYGSFAANVAIGKDRSTLVAAKDAKYLLKPRPGRRKNSATANRICCRTFVQKLPGDRWIQVQNRRSPAGRLISVQTDVSGLKRAEGQIRVQARSDPLTGLSNRAELFSRLARLASADREVAQPCALLVIDLDDFKGINDTYGHDAGDAFLQQLAQNLRSALRRSDTAARLGGDEFAVLLPGVRTPKEMGAILDKLQRAIARPVSIGNRTLIPSASIGVACFPRDGREPKELMKSADHALYHCKKHGRGGYSIFDKSIRRQLARRAYLGEELRLSLKRKEIGVALQPQRDMTNGRHFGFEALVRWQLAGEWISPIDLISIAEEAGLVKQLSYQVIEKSLGIVAGLKKRGLEPGIVAFNTVASQLYDPEFPRTLLHILESYNFTPAEIELEVTENVILDRSADVIVKAIQNLHEMGFGIALDDFGTGYASLTHLKRFPLDRLKIDRSFVSGIDESTGSHSQDKNDFIISRTIVSLAHNLGLKVVAEGIENPRQYEELSNIGCDVAQGYFIGRPMNERDVEVYLQNSGISYFI